MAAFETDTATHIQGLKILIKSFKAKFLLVLQSKIYEYRILNTSQRKSKPKAEIRSGKKGPLLYNC